MRPLKEDLFAGFGVDRSNGVVTAAEADQRTVGRPACSVNGVVSYVVRQQQIPRRHIPDLDLSQTSRLPARDCQLCTVRRKSNRFDSLGQPDQSRRDARTIGFVQQDFVEPRNRQQGSVGRITQRRNNGRHGINRRVVFAVLNFR